MNLRNPGDWIGNSICDSNCHGYSWESAFCVICLLTIVYLAPRIRFSNSEMISCDLTCIDKSKAPFPLALIVAVNRRTVASLPSGSLDAKSLNSDTQSTWSPSQLSTQAT